MAGSWSLTTYWYDTKDIYNLILLTMQKTELFKNGPKWFPIATNLQIDTKVKSLGLSKLKFTVPNFDRRNDQKWPFWQLRSIWGSDNGPKEFSMSQNLEIDTKIKSLGLSKQNLRIWSFSGIFGFLYLNEIGVRGLKTLSYLDNFCCEHLSQ